MNKQPESHRALAAADQLANAARYLLRDLEAGLRDGETRQRQKRLAAAVADYERAKETGP